MRSTDPAVVAQIEAAAFDLAMADIFDTIAGFAAAVEVEHAVPSQQVRDYLATAMAQWLALDTDGLPRHLPAPVRLALFERAFMKRFGVPMVAAAHIIPSSGKQE